MTLPQGVATPLASALDKRGYETLTPVQEAVIADELAGRDALVSARTGSGKTVAFGLAIAADILGGEDRFGRPEAPLALAIAPTRELAMQVARELEWLYGEAGAVIATCVGGMDVRNERRALERGSHIVVGTPGRLRDHISRDNLDLTNLRAVVLDEADEMLDLGFREDLEFILEASPDERRTLMFSATVPKGIAGLAKNYQRNALRITTASEEKQHSDIEYRALICANPDRENAILNTLRYYDAETAIVFCSTRAAVAHLTARFSNRGFPAVSLSGELTQNERSHALQAMRDGRARVCIATDVAARGIDLPSLELVVHADLPTNAETLKHRSGRTGRAGRKGVSALIVPMGARRKAERLLRDAGIKAEWANPPSAESILQRDDERLLEDAQLSASVEENETGMVAALLEKHGAEQIAAAYIRQFRATRFAPEDIQDVPLTPQKGPREPREPRESTFESKPPRAREDFEESVWFSLSVGRKQNAEPRWLIPMLCRHGNISKRDIGAIRMQPTETFVEIHASSADGFMAALGPQMTIEGSLRVNRIDGTPELSAPAKRGGHEGRDNRDNSGKKPEWKKKPFNKDRDGGGFKGKPDGGPGGKSGKKFGGKPDGKFAGKPGGKPGGKPDWKKKPKKFD
ncbi:DEAD/DEAH box helicase [Pseudohoeflea suaedae]|uniref:DEAD/DEAH box helicase n=1 Tax=Pseudohoeflea suaedae TaxID=877384 RepID=A0A4R5PJB5_9HYPH|nr:DEAD/DEAH box helicase [Pseudohoeflea suaedae]TDH35751.1 DEAD/DEAH box helicase [Pseudohoeflea suaedae]